MSNRTTSNVQSRSFLRRREKHVLMLLAGPPSPFMTIDIEMLRKHYPVDVMVYQNKRLRFALEVFRRILRGKVGVVMFWFAVPSFGFGASLVARLLRCPIILITGGYDIAEMPEIGFGSMLRPKLRRLVIGMLRMANTVLTFSDDARRQVLRYANPRRLIVVYPAVDTGRFKPAPGVERDCLVVTVAFSIGHAFIRQKGLDTFVRAAALMPDVRFVLVGTFADDGAEALRAQAPPNVEFTARRISDEEVVHLFQRAKVYVQASMHEGFGVAIAEAMAAGCVPVVANVTAMPEVVGDSGFYAAVGDAEGFAEAIKQALDDDGSLSMAARARVVANFTVEHREKALIAEVGRMFAPRGYSD